MESHKNDIKLRDVSHFFEQMDLKTIDEKEILELLLIKTTIDKLLQSMKQK